MAWRLRGGRRRGPNRATAIVVARLVFTIAGKAERSQPCASSTSSRPYTTTSTSFDARIGLQQLARLEEELPADGAVPGPLVLALSPHAHRHRRAGECHCRRNAAGRGAAAAHGDADEIRVAIAALMANGHRAVRSPGWCTSSMPASPPGGRSEPTRSAPRARPVRRLATPLPAGRERAIARAPQGGAVDRRGPPVTAARRGRADRAFRR